MSKLIGLWSPAPQSGKSTVATSLYGYARLAFAAPIKDMLSGLLATLGMPAGEIVDRLGGSRKEELIPGLDQSARDLLISLGTRWGRQMVSPDLWVRAWENRARTILRDTDYGVVCDDVRTPNEAAAIRRLGGRLVGVIRPGAVVTPSSALLEGLLTQADMDGVIWNDGTLEDLRVQARGLVR